MKTCVCCKIEKSTSEFHKNKNEKDGLQRRCKQCNKSSYQRSRNKNIERYRQVQKARQNQNAKTIREWKEQQGCKCCKESFGPCLELHHLDSREKEADPSQLATYSTARFMKEAKKCIVVCANCHRKIHHGVIDVKNFIRV